MTELTKRAQLLIYTYDLAGGWKRKNVRALLENDWIYYCLIFFFLCKAWLTIHKWYKTGIQVSETARYKEELKMNSSPSRGKGPTRLPCTSWDLPSKILCFRRRMLQNNLKVMHSSQGALKRLWGRELTLHVPSPSGLAMHHRLFDYSLPEQSIRAFNYWSKGRFCNRK